MSSLTTNKLLPVYVNVNPFATVSATTGTVNTGSFTDSVGTWTFYRFTTSGTITFNNASPGYADILTVGGGGGAGATDVSGYASGGGGGGVTNAYLLVSAGTLTVTVGGNDAPSWVGTSAATALTYAGQGTGGSGGRPSSGGLSGNLFGGGDGTNSAGGGGARGSGGSGSGSAGGAGLTVNVTGSSIEYGKGGGASNGVYGGGANTGGGASNSGASQGAKTGSSGVVVIRVRTA
jgi:hypothetical protein